MPKYPDVQVRLLGEDGNAFAILGRVRKALQKAGHGVAVEEFTKEATAGDYDHLLRTVLEWVSTDDDEEDEEEWDEDEDETCPECGCWLDNCTCTEDDECGNCNNPPDQCTCAREDDECGYNED